MSILTMYVECDSVSVLASSVLCNARVQTSIGDHCRVKYQRIDTSLIDDYLMQSVVEYLKN